LNAIVVESIVVGVERMVAAGVLLLRCVVTLVQIVCAGAMTDSTVSQLPSQLDVAADVLRW
jgi:hypothetical protein